jgi:hypothetical protein
MAKNTCVTSSAGMSILCTALHSFLLSIFLSVAHGQALAEPASLGSAIKVELVRGANGDYQLLRGGQPYHIRGAGLETADIASFAAHGGNSLRTWTTEFSGTTGREFLDAAAINNVTVALCLELGKERHGFDYDDEQAVARQLAYARREVLKYKDHPALLFWIIGNELNHSFKNPRVFDAIDDISRMIHSTDGKHPTTTALSGFSAELLALVEQRAPDLDFPSIQLYGGLDDLARGLEETAYRGPLMLTEWGTTGHWEVARTTWGAPVELTSSEKARIFLGRYEHVILPNEGQIIGNYVFLWGQKQERTPTWYSMMLEDGSKTEAMDVMHYIWTGEWPESRAPRVEGIFLDSRKGEDSVILRSGVSYIANVVAFDPEGGELTYNWELMRESEATQEGGDLETIPDRVPGRIQALDAGEISIRAPVSPGAYRLFARVYDDEGLAGHANIPFMVKPAK